MDKSDREILGDALANPYFKSWLQTELLPWLIRSKTEMSLGGKIVTAVNIVDDHDLPNVEKDYHLITSQDYTLEETLKAIVRVPYLVLMVVYRGGKPPKPSS
jgi:hypothetical protein